MTVDLNKIDDLHERATRSPWRAQRQYGHWWTVERAGGMPGQIARFLATRPDAELAVALRNAWPELRDELIVLRAATSGTFAAQAAAGAGAPQTRTQFVHMTCGHCGARTGDAERYPIRHNAGCSAAAAFAAAALGPTFCVPAPPPRRASEEAVRLARIVLGERQARLGGAIIELQREGKTIEFSDPRLAPLVEEARAAEALLAFVEGR